MAKTVPRMAERGGPVSRLALLLLVSSGCGTTVPPPAPAEPESPVPLLAEGSVCGVPGCPSADGREAAGGTAILAEVRAPKRKPDSRSRNPVMFEMDRGDTVRERFDSSGKWTWVEIRVKEVSGGEPGSPGRVSYTMRICTADGRTEAEARRPTKSGKWEICYTDTVYEVESGGRTRHIFPCPYGTAWEIDVTPDLLENGRVRFTLGGYWTPCTK